MKQYEKRGIAPTIENLEILQGARKIGRDYWKLTLKPDLVESKIIESMRGLHGNESSNEEHMSAAELLEVIVEISNEIDLFRGV